VESGEGPAPAALTREEFALMLVDARPKLWLIAAAVTGDRSIADDVVQEASIVALGKIGEFRRGTSFESWMGQIARNVALNSRRGRKRSVLALTKLRFQPVAIQASAASTGGVFVDDRLEAALNTLDPVARLCLVLRIVAGLPYETISAICDVPEGTAMSHVHRSRARLRTVLSGQEEGTR
jgi:RNA polymerase sigma-70 factor, ECF subfamily